MSETLETGVSIINGDSYPETLCRDKVNAKDKTAFQLHLRSSAT